MKRTPLKRKTGLRRVSNKPERRLELALDRKLKTLMAMMHNGKCMICYNPASELHHFIRRSRKDMRWMPFNTLLVCRNCHNKMHNDSAYEHGILAMFPARQRFVDQYRHTNFEGYSFEAVEIGLQLGEARLVIGTP